jgi:hypothetical protein
MGLKWILRISPIELRVNSPQPKGEKRRRRYWLRPACRIIN